MNQFCTLLLALALCAGVPRLARGDELSDELQAIAELRAQWRYEEARERLAALPQDKPGADMRYLLAEMAFLDGEYSRALNLLGTLNDDAGPHVATFRNLVTSTYRATKAFATAESAGGHFILYYPPGKDEVIVELAGEVLETAYQVLGDDFGYRPPGKVRVEILSESSDLARVSTLSEKEIETTGTIALCKYNKLMVVTPRATVFGYPWMDTLVHEYVHYVISRMTYDNTPVWLHEGLARFQQTRWRKGVDHTPTPNEGQLLAGALKNKKLITFDAMHPSMAKLPSQEAAALAFAEVFTMVSYLQSKVGYAGLRQVIELEKEGVEAREAVARVLGRTFEQVEGDWKAYLKQLKPVPAGKSSIAGQIRFRKGDGDDENVGVEKVASQSARKFARLGGMLRARGQSAAAAVEYEKALAIVGTRDPFIAAKLSRTYLELGNPKRAVELVRPIADLDERDAAATTTLGRALQELGDHAGAARALEQALRIAPFDPKVRCTLADAYQAIGDDRAARERAACEKLR